MRALKFLSAFFLLSLLSIPAFAQQSYPGGSGKDTYSFIATNQSSTLGGFVSIEPTATRGFKVVQICWTTPSITTAGASVWYFLRYTGPSTGGVLAIKEGGVVSGSPGNINKYNPASPDFPGIVRYGATLPVTGAVVDAWNIISPSPATLPAIESCRNYGINGETQPLVLPGLTNGIALNFNGGGTGGLSAMSIKIVVTLD